MCIQRGGDKVLAVNARGCSIGRIRHSHGPLSGTLRRNRGNAYSGGCFFFRVYHRSLTTPPVATSILTVKEFDVQKTLIACGLLVMTAAPAAAQLTPEQARAKADRAAVIVSVPAGTWRGRLLDIDADSVRILLPDGSARTLALSGVMRIDAKRRDSPVDGMFVGGLVSSLWCLLVCGQGLDSSHDLGGVVLRSGATGMLVGGLIDAAHTSTRVLYKAPAGASSRKAPGVFFTLRF